MAPNLSLARCALLFRTSFSHIPPARARARACVSKVRRESARLLCVFTHSDGGRATAEGRTSSSPFSPPPFPLPCFSAFGPKFGATAGCKWKGQAHRPVAGPLLCPPRMNAELCRFPAAPPFLFPSPSRLPFTHKSSHPAASRGQDRFSRHIFCGSLRKRNNRIKKDYNCF